MKSHVLIEVAGRKGGLRWTEVLVLFINKEFVFDLGKL